ncbi:MAG: glycosyltransferase family 39 protein [Longimicrobiales bacterium]|nr:glycosyltransferase family 39 protein [Longimicrobiales bacterium]
MGRQGPLIVAGVMIGIAGVIAAIGLVDSPTLFIPISLEAFLFLGVTALMIGRARAPSDRRFLWRVALLALALRAGAALLVYGPLDPAFFASDAYTYHVRGREVAEFLRLGGESRFAERLQAGYEWINGFFTLTLGENSFGPVVLNIFAGGWTALVAWAIGRQCFGEKVGRTAAVLVAIFPSLVLWSVLNIRDALATFLVATLMLIALRSYRRVHLPNLILFVLVALALSTLRDYMGVLMVAGLGLGYALGVRPGRLVSTLVMGTVLSLVVFFLLERFEVLTPEVIEDPFASATTLRAQLQQDFGGGLAGSAITTEIDTSTLGGALTYLPLGLIFFLFAPFPWAITSLLQAATLPETLFWYALFPFAVMGLRDTIRSEHADALLIVGVLAITVSSYALVEGSFGTAYRHRSQFLPLFFVFVAQGLVGWWRERMRRRYERNRKIAEAKAALFRRAPGR